MEHSILQPGLNFAPCESRRWSQPQRSSPAVSGNEALIHGTRQDWRYHTPSVPIFEISTTMTVSWISWASLFFICLLPCTMGVTNQFQLEPMTAAVLKGSDAQFIARVTGSWTIMTWIVGGFLVLTVNGNTTISLSEQYSATFCSSDNSSCVEFTIHNISRSLSGPVTCAVQGLFGEKTAQLYVQENGMINITGPSMKVMYDQQVEFQCVTAGWYPKPTVTWTLNGNAMNSTLDNFTDNGDFFNSTSVLTFQAVRDTTVKCLVSIPALTSPQSTSLFLVVVTNQFQLEPMTAAVLKGSDAQFIARVTGSWTIMTWIVGGFLVLTVNGNTTISLSEQYSATFCSSDNSSCVEFTIHNISRSLSGPVTCAVQGLFGEKTAQLYVQENGMINITGPSMKVMYDQQVEFQCVTAGWYPKPTVTWTLNGNAMNSTLDNFTDNGDFFNSTSVLTFQAVRDTTVKCLVSIPALTSPQSTSLFLVVAPKPPNWTVLIAVVVSFGSLALLVLLIIGIWFFYKRRKEKQTNYQDEMRRVRTQSQLSGVHGPRNKEGQVNTTYVPEGQTSVPTSEITDNGVFQVSTVANSAQAGVYNFEDPGFMKHRHVTIV
ncbi:unnamed protein product [Oreochromis niloticus]|nr:unnamed protein product [Mustela putorius furo]